MSKDTFKGLDNLIFDQPDFIDLNATGSTDAPAGKTPTDTESDITNNKEGKKKPEASEISLEDDNLITIGTIDDEDAENDDTINDTITGDEDKSKDEVNTPEDTLKAWGEYFKGQNILSETDLEDFDGTEESLAKAFENREYRVGLEMVDDYKSQLPDMLKYLADNWEDGVPLTDLLNIKSNQIRYANITEDKLKDSVDTQKAVYAEYLRKTTKYSDTKIEKEITRLVDLDELYGETKDALVDMKKFEDEAEDTIRKETAKEKIRRMEQDRQTIQKYEKAAKSTKEIIPGIKIDEKTQEDILKKAINPIGIDGNGNSVTYIQSIRNEDPIAFDIKLNYLMTVTKGLTDFSKITTTASTKATKDLSKILESKAPKGKEAIDTSNKKGVLDYLKMPHNKPKN